MTWFSKETYILRNFPLVGHFKGIFWNQFSSWDSTIFHWKSNYRWHTFQPLSKVLLYTEGRRMSMINSSIWTQAIFEWNRLYGATPFLFMPLPADEIDPRITIVAKLAGLAYSSSIVNISAWAFRILKCQCNQGFELMCQKRKTLP